MHTAAILETSGRLFPLLLPAASGCDCRLFRPAPGEKFRCAMLIVSPDWQGEAPDVSCRILLTPPDKAALLSRVRAERIVSFGPSARASISFSSRTPESLTLSVRREVPTLSGRMLEMQEIPMRCPPGEAEESLALCAATLLMGAKP